MEANVNDLLESIEGVLNERIKVLKQYSHNNRDYLDGVEDTHNAIMDVMALERDLYIDKNYKGASMKSIVISDNATNGDVIKTIFPNATIRMKEEHNSSGWNFRPQIVVEFSETHSQYFDEVWWNTPYNQ